MHIKYARVSLAVMVAAVASVSAQAADPSPTTMLVSKATSGMANGDSGSASMTPDGRYVAFSSKASNLVPGDTNNIQDVFVADRRAGTLERVSVSSTGAQVTTTMDQAGRPNGNGSYKPSISASGRYVAFLSDAVDVLPQRSGYVGYAYIRDRVAGTTALASLSFQGDPVNPGPVVDIALSADGSALAFTTDSAGVVAGDTNGVSDIFVRDFANNSTTRVSVGSSAVQGNGASDTPAISADGRYVAFRSASTNFWPNDTNGSADVFRRDRLSGTTMLASYTSGNRFSSGDVLTPGQIPHVAVSSDGSSVAFDWSAGDMMSGDTNNVRDVFVRNLGTGSLGRASLDEAGAQFTLSSELGSIAGGGSHVGFVTGNALVSPSGTSTVKDVFVRDLSTSKTARASLTAAGARSAGDSGRPVLSSDGSQVGFESKGALTPEIDPNSNSASNVFVRGVPLASLPSVPAIATPAQGSIQRGATVQVTGSARPGNSVSLYDNGVLLSGGAITVAGNGTWAASRTFSEGAHSLAARASDGTGETTAPSAARSFSVDLSAITPVITAPAEGAVAGASTNATGTAYPLANVTLSDGGVDIGAATADQNGAWSIALSALAEGSHAIVAKSVDPQSRTTTSATRSFSIDATPPAAPTIDADAPTAGSYIASPRVTVRGSGDAGSSVTVREGAISRGTAVVAPDGSWSLTGTFVDGAHSIVAVATDPAGNASVASASRGFTTDTALPQVSFSTADRAIFTPAAPVTVTGKYADWVMGSRVTITYTDVRGTVAASNTGTCTCAVRGLVPWTDAPTLEPGTYTVTAQGYDAAGNHKAASITIIVL